ncbi:putative ATPase [Stackebrandtia albiflava]|uniref:Putative ATPase n=1 Tax=Stackebrandtia albiflava TaxID=406432 RepID=A0A562URC9_9ACTN|nr:AAA family ATPase [Stackebrandtia albiflava]TWJ08185.1 putative ATPase [Stackebrandtia albiflava]
MRPRLQQLHVENFRSLRDVTVELGGLNVLVGPNGAGKSNVLQVLAFLGRIAESDLPAALDDIWPKVMFGSAERSDDALAVSVTGTWTGGDEGDDYRLRIGRIGEDGWHRTELFHFADSDLPMKMLVSHDNLVVGPTDGSLTEPARSSRHSIQLGVDEQTSALALIPRLTMEFGGREVTALAQFLQRIRFIDSDITNLRQTGGHSRYRPKSAVRLADDAGNLAAYLLMLHDMHPDGFADLQADAVSVLPQLESIDFEFPSGPAREAIVVLHETGLRRPIELADASLGTIRLIALLAALHDPTPPPLTCIEEIEFGLHPQALELLVERLREASERTQLIVATHSPTFVDRLRPDEIIVCERRDDGSSAIPAISTEQIREIVAASEDEPLGRLWFSGALGGDI